ncbi:MAG: hypothetical protein F6K40_02625 [Okeania sp. SIO3I5]|uniref:hypothetical protein n=1 Tax=Okeania sp. SIO3I5 TaxID=2607805 RepID=UPI0013B7B4CF|nr:hypothetical protein [Okeania sp. SIO3I5]NEQ35257.1 hypothetical protein [Okeania sp. SIO3I5]
MTLYIICQKYSVCLGLETKPLRSNEHLPCTSFARNILYVWVWRPNPYDQMLQPI